MTSPDTRPQHQDGARPLRDPDRNKSLLWLWILLGLLGLLALAAGIFLLVRNAGDDDDKGGVDVTNEDGSKSDGGGGSKSSTTKADDSSKSSTTVDDSPTTTAGGAPTTTAGGTATTAPGGGASGDLKAGDTALLPLPSGGVAPLVDEKATGGATVESVVADEGFWVGEGPGKRVFVHLSPEARTSSGESPFQVKAGQQISLEGTVTAAPADAADLGVTDAEGATELTDQGAYVEATKVTLQ